MRFIGHILGFIGALVVFAAIWPALSGNLGWALVIGSSGLSLMTFDSVVELPAWAFELAQQMSKPVWLMSKPVWLLIAIIGVVVPFLGLISFALWVKRGRVVRAVVRARRIGQI
jgi:hypothetical protein